LQGPPSARLKHEGRRLATFNFKEAHSDIEMVPS
jgi:hypothetical protein